MLTVIGGVTHHHNLWLVLLAALLCVTGSWVTARLFLRTTSTYGAQRGGWLFMTALAAGVAIWCTHFVAMLGFEAVVPMGLDLGLTVVSLLVAIFGSTIGFVVAGSQRIPHAPALGGAVVGLAISAMHYIGMAAYRVHGSVTWDKPYLVASIVLAVVLSALALHCAMRPGHKSGNLMAAILALAIIVLHFTGMAAFRVDVLPGGGESTNPEALRTLAVAVAVMSFVIVGAGLVSYLLDDRIRSDAMERLRQLALNDALTGLPNRINFNERLDLEMSLSRGSGHKLALIGIDFNRFKEINDLHGHKAGDEVLRILGRRMMGLLDESAGEFVARTGGDEFAAIFRMDEGRSITHFLHRLEMALFKPIRFDEAEISPGASFGVAIYPDDATDKESLINNADLAMYRAKGDPMRRVCFYEPSMDEKVRTRRHLTAELRQALSRNQLSLHYQVQTSVATGEIRGYEVLLRWRHPQLGNISPADFIPLAEENGLILQIGEWVMRTACAEAAGWNPPYKVAVNLSAVQLVQADLLRIVTSALVDSGLPPERLELELTETALFTDRERALHMLGRIKALGVSIALDDFGIGYSSLDTLRAFPFDRIKIDRSFFSDTVATPQTTAIIQAVLALGKTFGIPVLAEGIESPAQLAMLNAAGCEEAQGFLLGRPASLQQIVSDGGIRLEPHAPT